MRTCNPYLPCWEYIPDGEPHVFGDRVYVYGSHDRANGYAFCLDDYVCWSAPVTDLGDWRYEGVIYRKTDDPRNPDGEMCLYAPDVTRGPDGRYYLYYVPHCVHNVSVAVCDTPAGKYEFHGFVHYPDGTLLGDAPGDEAQFDPGVLTEGEHTYLYTGFGGHNRPYRHGAMMTVLGPDMCTIEKAPVFIAPNDVYSGGTSFEGHAFFEAPSIRRVGDLYCFIYSSEAMHELCWSTAERPEGPYTYRGVLVSNADIGIGSYKSPKLPITYAPANNHGSIEKIGENWYIFYHRHTHGTWFSRQGCIERLSLGPDGGFLQAEVTSSGAGGPLPAKEELPAYLACALYLDTAPGRFGGDCPKIVLEREANGSPSAYIANVQNGTVVGFKYLDFQDVRALTFSVRGNLKGDFEVALSPDGEAVGRVPVDRGTEWKSYAAPVHVPDGVHAVYLRYRDARGPKEDTLRFGQLRAIAFS